MLAVVRLKKAQHCRLQKTKNTNKEKVENNLEEEDVPGDVLFVLENKFKSIPYQEQLAEYLLYTRFTISVLGLKSQSTPKQE